MIELQQTWYHIFDNFKENEREIHQVLDFFTNEQFIYLNVITTEFTQLKIFGRNLNREMGFIEEEGIIVINLGNLEDFPLIEKNTLDHAHHVRIQINYIDNNAQFNKFKFFKTGYSSSFLIVGKMQPEFTINIQKGLFIKGERIENENIKLRSNIYTQSEICLGIIKNNSYSPFFDIYKYEEWKDINIFSIQVDEIFYIKLSKSYYNNKEYKLSLGLILDITPLNFDYSYFNGSHESYKFIIDKKSYKLISKTPELCFNIIDFGYTVKNKKSYLIFPISLLALNVIFIIFIIISDFNTMNYNMSIPLSCLITSISFLTLFIEFSLFK
ncbi:MAG: hypothetical protein ACRCVG_07880, partial [Methanobacteriaceae archaeon]